MARSDPPYHRMLRAIVAPAFSPIMISKLEPRIESTTHDLINQVIDKGNMDLITDLAYSLPVIVIAELLSLPLEDRDIFRVWADKIASSTNNDESYRTNTDNFLNLQSEMDDHFNAIIDWIIAYISDTSGEAYLMVMVT